MGWLGSTMTVMAPKVEDAADAALALLRTSASDYGFVASASLSHYSLWVRDMAFSAMGANVSGDAGLVDAARRSLLTIAPMQASTGQIPNVCWPPDYWDWGEAGTTDASCHYIIAAAEHLASHPDPDLQRRLWPVLVGADRWLQCQDTSQFGLIQSGHCHDWMESSFNRSGKVMHVNALYARAVAAMAGLAPSPELAATYHARATVLRTKFNELFWPRPGFNIGDLLGGVPYPTNGRITFGHSALPAAHAAAARPDRGHYISHVTFAQFVDECDVLGNVLAVLYDLAPTDRAMRIMEFLLQSEAASPFPARTYPRTFEAGDPARMYNQAQDTFQDPRWRNRPGRYHNGAVWPFIGGLYVMALAKVGLRGAALNAIESLADAVRISSTGEPYGFHEWIGLDGTPSEIRDQTWGAGTFVAAFRALWPRESGFSPGTRSGAL